jgi:hypothetical protein
MVIHCQLPIIGYCGRWRLPTNKRQAKACPTRVPFPREIQPAKGFGTSFEAPDSGGGMVKTPPKRWQSHNLEDNSNVFCKIEMLTPKGEHSFPCSTRVMFDGRISFDGIATVKTL